MGRYGDYVLNQAIRIPARKFKKLELLDKCLNAPYKVLMPTWPLSNGIN